jgi:hypothetical protein
MKGTNMETTISPDLLIRDRTGTDILALADDLRTIGIQRIRDEAASRGVEVLEIPLTAFRRGASRDEGTTVYVTHTVETKPRPFEQYSARTDPSPEAPGSKWGDQESRTDIVCEYLGAFVVMARIPDPDGWGRVLLVPADTGVHHHA